MNCGTLFSLQTLVISGSFHRASVGISNEFVSIAMLLQDGAAVVSDSAYITRNPTLCPNKNIAPRPYTGQQLGFFSNVSF